MDIEVSSIIALIAINFLILISIIIYLFFYYKWDSKTYDDMAENLDNYRPMNGNDLFLGEGTSNIESLLGKDDTTVLPA